jgi:hypothetical protein
LNEEALKSFMELLLVTTEDFDLAQREVFGARVCEELRMSPTFSFLPENVWHRVDPMVVN